MKQTILALTIGLFVMTTKGQTVKDYFILDSTNYNMTSYYYLNPLGKRLEISLVLLYEKIGTTYNITETQIIIGKINTVKVKSILFTDTEVKMTKLDLTDLTSNKTTNCNPPIVILKMPIAGKTVSWTYKDIEGENTKCTASWTSVTIAGKEKKAIKCVEQYQDLSEMIRYYVEGIGFWQSEMKTTEGTFTFEKFKGISYDPSAK